MHYVTASPSFVQDRVGSVTVVMTESREGLGRGWAGWCRGWSCWTHGWGCIPDLPCHHCGLEIQILSSVKKPGILAGGKGAPWRVWSNFCLYLVATQGLGQWISFLYVNHTLFFILLFLILFLFLFFLFHCCFSSKLLLIQKLCFCLPLTESRMRRREHFQWGLFANGVLKPMHWPKNKSKAV